jgi:hypothetical protein
LLGSCLGSCRPFIEVCGGAKAFMVDPPTLTVRYRTVSIVTSTGSF